MRKLLYISLLFITAGCSQQLTPQLPPTQPGVPSGDLSNYFWPDTNAVYFYQPTAGSGDSHTITVNANGTIVDNDSKSSTNTTLSLTRTSTSYSLTGFSPNDFLGLDSYLQVVQDTNTPTPRIETIRSIAAVNKFSFGKLYVASDSVLYQIDFHSNALVRSASLPASGLTLAEDYNSGGLFAFQRGGNAIYWTSNGGSNWTTYSLPAGNAITAFTSVNRGEDHSSGVFWAAAGPKLYQYSNDSTGLSGPFTFPVSNITALESSQDGVIAGTDSGALFDVAHDGEIQPKGFGPGIRGIAGNYIATSVGIFDFTRGGQSPAVVSGDFFAIYSTFFSTYAADSSGLVDHITGNSNNSVLPAPHPGYTVTQFAYPNQGSGVYAVAGGVVYYYSQSASAWVNVNQTLSPAPSFSPGALTLLSSDTSWTAGYVESVKNGISRGFTYQARSSGILPQTWLTGIQYNNLIIVTFTAMSGGVADVVDVPQYNIYFQKGKGPIRVDRMENGITTTLVRPN